MANKGVVIYLLCENPSCSFSEEKLVIKQPLVVSGSSGKCNFSFPKECPKCKTSLELLNFVSGSVEIQPDKLDN